MRVRYTPEAFADRERIFEYLRERSASGARNVMASISDAAKLLREQPHSGYKTDDPSVRVLFVRRYPYKLFYRIQADDIIEIAHIRHTSRRPWAGER
jgi:plasmid stabilization system protein ParE